MDFLARSLARSKRIRRNQHLMSGTAAIVTVAVVGGLAWQLTRPAADQPTPVGEHPASPTATAGAAPPVTPSSGPPSSPAAPPTSASPGPAFAAACTADHLLAFANTQAKKPEGGYRRVQIYNCVAPYARIYAGPKEGMPGSSGEQFFLQYTNGTWTVLKTGLGVDCGDNAPEIKAACAAFEASAGAG